jgi:hypothetical protein
MVLFCGVFAAEKQHLPITAVLEANGAQNQRLKPD